MQTITVDILNDKVLRVLQDLEVLQLIRVHKEQPATAINRAAKYKGAMTKQPLPEVDNQLNELRNAWE